MAPYILTSYKNRKNGAIYGLQLLHTNSSAIIIEERNNGSLNNGLFVGSFSSGYTPLRKCSTLAASSNAHFSCNDQSKEGDEVANVTFGSHRTEYDRVDCVVWVLHESARSFSQAVESLGLARNVPGLAMAWIGKDVHEWHRRISYQVAVYALMKTAIDLEILLSHERQNECSPVREILAPLINQLGEHIEIRLNMRHPSLVQWFRDTEITQIAGHFIPLLKKWTMEYAGSCVAGIIVAITCCSAVVKLGTRRICCPILLLSLENVLVKLMDYSLNLASVDKLHQLAIDAGFELNYLSHFGRNLLPSEKTEDLEFWIGLAHKKLLKAFGEKSIVLNMQNFQLKIQSDSLATLGLFAYLGRHTRMFLLAMGIKDLDETVQNFLSFSWRLVAVNSANADIAFYVLSLNDTTLVYDASQIVTDEIGWLDFYASYVERNCSKKRPKLQARQAEQEIILSVVFTVCYDVFSGFAHFNRSTQQSLDTASLSYLLRCQGLLGNSLQDHWAAYDKSGESTLIVDDHAATDHHASSSYIGSINGTKLPLVFEAQRKPHELTTERCLKSNSQNSSTFKKEACEQGTCTDKLNPRRESFIKRYSIKLASTSEDLWMGTQLLFIDIKVVLELFVRQLHGCKASRSQRKRLERTLTDIIVLIPVTILMLLPVSTPSLFQLCLIFK
ncbi:hypothetical protein RIF29_28841 [Crotalaria pallida]|uniref:Uncharacterized protein n=1 Tax=Crotalaria pallida TaxID=3830 RepID=A0AAN9EDI1_CROPI